jgi:hypothetical protein
MGGTAGLVKGVGGLIKGLDHFAVVIEQRDAGGDRLSVAHRTGSGGVFLRHECQDRLVWGRFSGSSCGC